MAKGPAARLRPAGLSRGPSDAGLFRQRAEQFRVRELLRAESLSLAPPPARPTSQNWRPIAFVRIASGGFQRAHEIEEHPHRRQMSVQAPVFFLARERNSPRRPGPPTSSAPQRCGCDARFTVVETAPKGDPCNQPPGIGECRLKGRSCGPATGPRPQQSCHQEPSGPEGRKGRTTIMQEIIDVPSNVQEFAVALSEAGVKTVISVIITVSNSSRLSDQVLDPAGMDALHSAGLSVAVVFEQGGGANGDLEDLSDANGTADAERGAGAGAGDGAARRLSDLFRGRFRLYEASRT